MKRGCGGVREMYRSHIAANIFEHKQPVVWCSFLGSAAPTYLPNQLNGRKAHERSRSCFEKQTKFNLKVLLCFSDSCLHTTSTLTCYRFGSVFTSTGKRTVSFSGLFVLTMPSTTELLLGSLSLLLVFIGSAEAAAADGAVAAIDVTQYSRLYVKYQNCVWSPSANGCGNNNQQQNNNQNQQQNSYWYSSFAPCYRANVAYTVYGVKVDDTGTYKTGGECNKKGNYIGSYFTTNGVEDFFNMLTQAGVGMWKSYDDNGEGGNGDNNKGDDDEMGDCQVISNNQAGDNGENNNNNKQEAAQYDYTANNRKMYGETTSAGLGCSNKHKFAVKMYQGAYCDERAVLDVTDNLETLNDELEDSAQCVLIYSAAVEAVAAAEDDGADADAENEQENEEQQQQQQQQEINNAGDLLVNSEACNVRLFPQTCPDPHGLLHSDARAVGQRLSSQRRSMPIVRQVFSWIFMSLGGLFIGASAWACCNKTARAEKFKRNRTNNNNDSTLNKGWRTQFKRANDTTVDQIKATAAAATGTAATSKRRRFFRMFSRGAKS
jgi:hypothetical protein